MAVGPLLAALDPDALEGRRDDLVGALLAVLSEGILAERDVLLATLAPPLGPPGAPLDEATLAAHEALPAALPAPPAGLQDEVARALARQRPPPRHGPDLSPEARRAHMRRAAAAGTAGLVLGAVGAAYAPPLAVLAAPVVALSAVVLVIHGVALRQAR